MGGLDGIGFGPSGTVRTYWEVVMAKNTGNRKRVGLLRNRFQKFNPLTGLWGKYDTRGKFVVGGLPMQ